MVTCPSCGSSDLWNRGPRRFSCKTCKRRFSYPTKSSNKPTKLQDKTVPIPIPTEVCCPHCGGRNLRRNGKASWDRQRYFCKDCIRDFRYPPIERRIQSVSIDKANAKINMDANRVVHLTHLTVDSLDGIPCFLCPEQSKCDEKTPFNPITCVRLAESFGIPPIHEYVPTNQVFLTDSQIEEGNTQRRKEDL